VLAQISSAKKTRIAWPGGVARIISTAAGAVSSGNCPFVLKMAVILA